MAQMPTTESTGQQRLAIEDSVLVQASPQEVYEQWSDLTNFPEFMRNVISVTSIGENRYHWVASFFGQRQEWDSEVTTRNAPSAIGWRNVNGQGGTGQLTFTPRDENNVEVRLQMEVAAPADLTPQRFNKLAESARKNTHEDLQRYSKRVGTPAEIQALAAEEAAASMTSLATQVGVAIVGAGIAGYAAWAAQERLRQNPLYRALQSPISRPFALGGWGLIGASGASIIGAATLRQIGQINNALFVGQWAPTFLAGGTLVRLLGHRGVQTSEPANVATWSLAGASLGSIGASVTLHILGRRKQGLFVGQWAPTLMGAAVLTRLFNRA